MLDTGTSCIGVGGLMNEDDGLYPRVRFGSWVRRWREHQNIPQQELAERVGINQDEVSKIERGTILRPGPERVIRIAAVLNRSIEDAALAAQGIDPDAMNRTPAQFSASVQRLLGADIDPGEADMLWDQLEMLRRWGEGHAGRLRRMRRVDDVDDPQQSDAARK
jgi:transcriptional regulator with XRE-family HTH domain